MPRFASLRVMRIAIGGSLRNSPAPEFRSDRAYELPV